MCGNVHLVEKHNYNYFKGVTLHRHLYFHPRPGSRSWPIKFLSLTPWPLQKSSLDPWLSSISHAHRAPGAALTVSKLPSIPCLTVWPPSEFRLDCLTSLWPRSRVEAWDAYLVSPPCILCFSPSLVCVLWWSWVLVDSDVLQGPLVLNLNTDHILRVF